MCAIENVVQAPVVLLMSNRVIPYIYREYTDVMQNTHSIIPTTRENWTVFLDFSPHLFLI
jgi:hypothetical protein